MFLIALERTTDSAVYLGALQFSRQVKHSGRKKEYVFICRPSTVQTTYIVSNEI